MFAAPLSFSLISLLYIGTALAVLTLILAWMDLAAESWANPLDRSVSRFLIRHRTDSETRAMRLFSWLGGPFGISLLALVNTACLLKSGQGRAAEFFVLILAASAVYVLTMKLMTARQRPSWKVLERERTYSFPSAHSLLSTVAYGSAFILLHHMNGWWIGSVLLFLGAIGTSRIYLGCHYLSDVIAGILGGAVWVGILVYLVDGYAWL